jgi:hypothetical protein
MEKNNQLTFFLFFSRIGMELFKKVSGILGISRIFEEYREFFGISGISEILYDFPDFFWYFLFLKLLGITGILLSN